MDRCRGVRWRGPLSSKAPPKCWKTSPASSTAQVACQSRVLRVVVFVVGCCGLLLVGCCCCCCCCCLRWWRHVIARGRSSKGRGVAPACPGRQPSDHHSLTHPTRAALPNVLYAAMGDRGRTNSTSSATGGSSRLLGGGGSGGGSSIHAALTGAYPREILPTVSRITHISQLHPIEVCRGPNAARGGERVLKCGGQVAAGSSMGEQAVPR